MKIAKPLSDLIESFEKLPGIGPKTAQRLTFYMLRVPQSEIAFFAERNFGKATYPAPRGLYVPAKTSQL